MSRPMLSTLSGGFRGVAVSIKPVRLFIWGILAVLLVTLGS